MTKASWLKTAFLSTAMAIGGLAAFAQEKTHATEQQAKTGDGTVGFLLVRGPEHKDDPQTIGRSKAPILIKNFQKKFKNTPMQIVGNGTDDIEPKMIIDALDSLAETDIKTIVLALDVHGENHLVKKTLSEPMNDSTTVETTTSMNHLMIKSDGTTSPLDSLCMAIGERFRINPKLHDKKLLVDAFVCHSSMAAFHHLPTGTGVFYYSDNTSLAEVPVFANPFSQGFSQLDAAAFKNANPEDKKRAILNNENLLPVNEKTVFAASVFASNRETSLNKNKLHYLEITGEKADTLDFDGHALTFGGHGSKLVTPDSALKKIVKEFDDDRIIAELAEYKGLVDESKIRAALQDYRAGKKIDDTKQAAEHINHLNFAAIALAKKHPHLMQNSLEYATDPRVQDLSIQITPKPRTNKIP